MSPSRTPGGPQKQEEQGHHPLWATILLGPPSPRGHCSLSPQPPHALTVQAEPVGAVFGVEQHAAAVLAAVAGGRGSALAAAPVGALGAAGRPLAPLRPRAIHCGPPNTDTRLGTLRYSPPRMGNEGLQQRKGARS